ncbi:MAG TPA: lipid-A-disaccharide synthase, partial [Porticoccaceae bacterium]|nr:lipid-A-disaccharide synthase [Porticoccaceae bacterium]
SDVPVTVLDAQSHLAMAAADVVLLASGTTALEAMLLKKPMVVSYKAGRVTHAIVSRMLKVPHVSLPNLLAGQPLVPELLQGEATVENLTAAVLRLFDAPDGNGALLKRFGEMHMALRQNADETAAQTLLDLIERRRGTGD